jgi:Na+-driven multidrug efflux pump
VHWILNTSRVNLAQPPEVARIMHLIFEIYVLLVLFAAAVLLIRIATPAYRKWVTLALNIVMLFLFPIGTALAIYGFLKVDKNIENPNG